VTEQTEMENKDSLETNLEQEATEAQVETDQKANDMEKSPAELIKELEEVNGRVIRLQADFDNYRRRSKKELEDMAKFGTEKIIYALLPVLDNFSRALNAKEQGGDIDIFLTGMEMIFKQLEEALEKEGLCKIEAQGCAFDPEYHDGVMQEPVEDVNLDNQIIDEFQKGYTLNGRVIRPSMVKVGKC
jgi:molecular chaperone GrpE